MIEMAKNFHYSLPREWKGRRKEKVGKGGGGASRRPFWFQPLRLKRKERGSKAPDIPGISLPWALLVLSDTLTKKEKEIEEKKKKREKVGDITFSSIPMFEHYQLPQAARKEKRGKN